MVQIKIFSEFHTKTVYFIEILDFQNILGYGTFPTRLKKTDDQNTRTPKHNEQPKWSTSIDDQTLPVQTLPKPSNKL